jgi:hypothetical protein
VLVRAVDAILGTHRFLTGIGLIHRGSKIVLTVI